MSKVQHLRRASDSVSSQAELAALLADADRAADVLPSRAAAELKHLRETVLHLTVNLTDKVQQLEAQLQTQMAALRQPAKDPTARERDLQREIDRLRQIIQTDCKGTTP